MRSPSYLLIVLLLAWPSVIVAQETPDIDPQEMMKRMQEHGTPGPQHELLGKLVGKWKTQMDMMGMKSEGQAEFKWILGKRFVQQDYSGTMMGQAFDGMGLFGYDNFKKKFTSTWVDSVSTTKNDAEGMLDRSGKVINFYGTLDEYLTGEHDKPVKYVLDLSREDEIRFEVHDLAIGDNSKVVEITYTRDE